MPKMRNQVQRKEHHEQAEHQHERAAEKYQKEHHLAGAGRQERSHRKYNPGNHEADAVGAGPVGEEPVTGLPRDGRCPECATPPVGAVHAGPKAVSARARNAAKRCRAARVQWVRSDCRPATSPDGR